MLLYSDTMTQFPLQSPDILFEAESESELEVEPEETSLLFRRGRRHSTTSILSSRDVDISKLREENARLQVLVDADRLTSEEDRLRSERQVWYDRFQAAKEDIKHLNDEITARDQTATALRERHAYLGERIGQLKEQLESAKPDEVLVQEITDLKDQLGKAVALIREAELKEEVKKSEQDIKIQEQALEIHHLHRQIFALEQRNAFFVEKLRLRALETGPLSVESQSLSQSTPSDPVQPSIEPPKTPKSPSAATSSTPVTPSDETPGSPITPETFRTAHECPPTPEPINISITLTAPQKTHLIHRIHSVISASINLRITGPEPHVADLRANILRTEADHVQQTALAAKWEKVATAYAAEIEVLKERPLCLVPKHRNMADELEAKNLQFMMQEQLMADWRRREEEAGGGRRRSGDQCR